ncbi:MAG: MFS transporter [Burkholderiaceae bacterium]
MNQTPAGDPEIPLAAGETKVPRYILPAIVVAQLAGGSVWFGANAVIGDLIRELSLASAQVGWLLSAVNTGFIAGTLCYALMMVADRISPRLVFLISCLLAAAVNAVVLLMPVSYWPVLLSRFAVGFFLAGIYPVGMKIAAGWYQKGLGSALGFLVGALIVASGMPHAVRALGSGWSWQQVLLSLSVIAALGGVLLYLLVPDGPYLNRGSRLKFKALSVIWTDRKVRASTVGYFGHMWELYAMLAAVPALIGAYLHSGLSPAVSLLSFFVIAGGGIGCALGGLLTPRFGSARVAVFQLAVSGLCCVLVPLMLGAPWWLFALWLIVWGITVSGDSPQFSALTASNAPRELVGSVLTLVNCIGFAISTLTIQLTTHLSAHFGLALVLPWLVLGPLAGLIAMWPLLGNREKQRKNC